MHTPKTITRKAFLGLSALGISAVLGGCDGSDDLPSQSAMAESGSDNGAASETKEQVDDAVTSKPSETDDVSTEGAYVGSFDYVDDDGYSYRIDCSLNPAITTDSSDGKPGYIGLYMDFSDCSVTINNTTSGKKAPGFTLMICPLYPSDMADMMGENNRSGNVREFVGPDGCEYVDPITNIVDPNTYVVMEVYAGVPGNNYGTTKISGGDELQPNESRELSVRAGHIYSDVEASVRMPDILEEYADAVKKPSGWAFTTARGNEIGYIMATSA